MHNTSATGNATDGVTRTSHAPTLLSAQAARSKPASWRHRKLRRQSSGRRAVVTLPWTVQISNTSALSNAYHGINVGAVKLVTITHVSAIGNGFDGIRLPYAEDLPTATGGGGRGAGDDGLHHRCAGDEQRGGHRV